MLMAHLQTIAFEKPEYAGDCSHVHNLILASWKLSRWTLVIAAA